MTDIHSCSLYCDRPECIKAQRDELRDKLAQPAPVRKCRSCDGAGEVSTGIWESPTSICKPCSGTGQIATPPAAPVQEPVAWGFQNSAITGSNRWIMLREEVPSNDQYGGALWIPLYTTPPQRTEPFFKFRECEDLQAGTVAPSQRTEQESSVLIPASLAEKQFERYYRQGYDAGFAAQPEQEPVALQVDVIVVNLVREGINKHRARELAEHFIKYTTPQQRTWVGLTDEERMDILLNLNWDKKLSHMDTALAIEAKLRSKNEHR